MFGMPDRDTWTPATGGVTRSAALAAMSLAGFAGVSLAGCLGTPTPLAPGLEGSVGWPHHGVQTGAVELPDRGPGFARYRSQGIYYWGQPELIDGIQEAARRVHEALPGGAPLLVGDISARDGGKIARHYSHRSGRDVDLLWYVTTPDGASIRSPTFVRLGADGLGRIPDVGGFVRLDVPRQWELIKALLTSQHIEVQWLLASSTIEALVINYALARGDDAEIIWRAQNVMLEPADSLPHDDHLHLRIACSPEASARGCEGGGPYWNWLPPVLGEADRSELEPEPPASGRI
jgi:penicillin-insensitive murein DD-endopeptidase